LISKGEGLRLEKVCKKREREKTSLFFSMKNLRSSVRMDSIILKDSGRNADD